MFGEFNDPFEMIPGQYGFSIPEDEANEYFGRSSVDPATYDSTVLDIFSGVRASVGVICFTSKSNNLLMWSHYANNHEGICVEFDAKADFFTGKYKNSCSNLFENGTTDDSYENIGELKKVIYSTQRPLFIDPSELQTDTESWLRKSKEWRYEQEYRILLPREHVIYFKETLFYAIDKSAIKSVIIGCQVTEENKKLIYEKCSKQDIAVKESFINAFKYELDILDYHKDNHRQFVNHYNLARLTK
jgi:Protein of unknown function (DUF2971)